MDDLSQFKQLYAASESPVPYSKHVYRLVETQEIAATTNLVDDLDEQFLLEQMLDEVKPSYRPGTEDMHYLLKTPFRYPPLKYGSRFGSRVMPSFFYAGEDEHTTLAEVAYYRFVFLSHMQLSYDKPVRSEHMMFSVKVKSALCADLTEVGFAVLNEKLASPNSYHLSQSAGQWLVEQNIEVIRYCSARYKGGYNLAIAEPKVLLSKEPEKSQSWLCHSQNHKVSFARLGGEQPISFHQQEFLSEGQLPIPA
jgi:hypothetical protein